MKKIYSKYLNSLDLVNQGHRRIFIILHISLFLISIYWFFENYEPSDFKYFFNTDNWSQVIKDKNTWWTLESWGNGYQYPEQFGRIIIISISLLCFNFGFPYLTYQIFYFPIKFGVFKKKTILIIFSIKSLIFLFLFWLLWFPLKYEPFKKVDFKTYLVIKDHPDVKLMDKKYIDYYKNIRPNTVRVKSNESKDIIFDYYQTRFNSKLIYDLLLIFIPLFISFFVIELTLWLTIWVKDGFNKDLH